MWQYPWKAAAPAAGARVFSPIDFISVGERTRVVSFNLTNDISFSARNYVDKSATLARPSAVALHLGIMCSVLGEASRVLIASWWFSFLLSLVLDLDRIAWIPLLLVLSLTGIAWIDPFVASFGLEQVWQTELSNGGWIYKCRKRIFWSRRKARYTWLIIGRRLKCCKSPFTVQMFSILVLVYLFCSSCNLWDVY